MTLERTWRCARCGWLSPADAKACASCEKRKPRERKAKPPPSFRPWKCVVLALDAAAKTGWAVYALGKLADSGEFKIHTDAGVSETFRVVNIAKTFALQLGVPWVAIIEASWGGHMAAGKTPATGWWTLALRNAQLPIARIGDVYPSTWRARTLPRGMASAARDDVRACEVAAARAIKGGRDVGHDEAPAILIAKWAAQAGEVGAMLPKNARVTV